MSTNGEQARPRDHGQIRCPAREAARQEAPELPACERDEQDGERREDRETGEHVRPHHPWKRVEQERERAHRQEPREAEKAVDRDDHVRRERAVERPARAVRAHQVAGDVARDEGVVEVADELRARQKGYAGRALRAVRGEQDAPPEAREREVPQADGRGPEHDKHRDAEHRACQIAERHLRILERERERAGGDQDLEDEERLRAALGPRARRRRAGPPLARYGLLVRDLWSQRFQGSSGR
jgi:hypothetical protein